MKVPCDLILRKKIFLWRIMINLPKMMKRVRTKSIKWSDINPLDDLTQECKMPYDLHLEKNDFSMENDQFVKDEELSDEKFTNGLTQEIKLGGKNCPMILFLENIIWNGKNMPMNQWVKKTHQFLCFYLRTRDMRSYGCPTKFSFIPMSLKLNIYIGCLVPMI
jgi:hypothetical protein